MYISRTTTGRSMKCKKWGDRMREWTNSDYMEFWRKVAQARLDGIAYAKTLGSYTEALERRNEQLERANQNYAQMMFWFGLAAMRQGGKPGHLCNILGPGLACMMLASPFRPLDEDLYKDLEKEVTLRAFDSVVWQEHLDRVKAMDYVVDLSDCFYFSEVTAMVHIANCEQAYADMRKPQANVDRVLDDFNTAQQDLMRVSKEHHVDANDVITYADVLVKDGHFDQTLYLSEDMLPEPRMMQTFPSLYREQVGKMVSMFGQASNPEELQSVVQSKAMRELSVLYQEKVQADVHLSALEFHRDRAALLADEMAKDIASNTDPYHVNGMQYGLDDFYEYGPHPMKKPDVLENPEITEALALWMEAHEQYNPGYWQQQANLAYQQRKNYEDEMSWRAEIANCIAARDELMYRMNQVVPRLYQAPVVCSRDMGRRPLPDQPTVLPQAEDSYEFC